MKKGIIFAALAATIGTIRAEETATRALYIHLNGGVTQAVALSRVQELTYVGNNLVVNDSVELDLDDITEVTFGAMPEALTVSYQGTAASVVNPYFLDGVEVALSGADVVVNNSNTETEIETELSGTSSDGSLVYNGTYKTTLTLNGLTLTNTRGAAIDIECGKRVALKLKKGTTNTLVDGAGGTQKAALYCKGHLEIDKAGTLNVTGNTGHAISAKEYIQLKKAEGTINILGAVKDGIHCQQYFVANGYTVNISGTQDDGIDVEADGEENDEGYTDGSLNLFAGTFTIQTTTDAAKALIADSDININGGSINVVQSGTFVLESSPADTSYVVALRAGNDINVTDGAITVTSSATCGKALSANQDVNLLGGTHRLTMSGQGGKGIKADHDVVIGYASSLTGPSLTVSTSGAAYSWGESNSGSSWGWGWGGPGGGGGPGGQNNSNNSSAKGIKATNTISINGGNLTVTTTTDGAEGVEGKKGVTVRGGNHYLKCYDDCINSGGIVEFAGGTTACWSNGNDAIDSNYGMRGAITLSGGNVFAYSTKGSPEEGLDCDNNSYIVISGGIAVSAGGSQGGGSSSSVGSASQGYYLGSSPSSYNASYYYTLCNTSGTAVCTFKFGASCSNSLSLLTASDLGKGKVTIKYGSSKPTACSESAGDVFFIAPTVSTSGTTTTITAK